MPLRCITTPALVAAIAGSLLAPAVRAQVVIDRADYERRLRGMWLAQAVANWTGLVTEGGFQQPPFLTTAAWAPPIGTGTLNMVFQNPWGADDDTDIEYVYLHLLDQHQTTHLTPPQIRDGWISHINTFIWVSNATARSLMNPPASLTPPTTSMLHANAWGLAIDAQLTTEFFGALAPAMPHVALSMADLPIRTTATGHAEHASQFFVLLYSLAAQVPPGLSARDRGLWLVDRARQWIPNSSKAADIIDTVRTDYIANPNPANWERTRDLIYTRYQLNAAASGFVYRGWFESSVNFATGVMVLLYSEGDPLQAIRIGTLSGWDSDNPTATMGGLYGLMLGDDGIRAAFAAQYPGVTLSDRFWIHRTRPTMPDRLPADTAAEDTFTMMASRCAQVVDRAVLAAGGTVLADRWILPAPPATAPLNLNPSVRREALSANAARRALAAESPSTPEFTVTTNAAAIAPAWPTTLSLLADGFEASARGTEAMHWHSTPVVLTPPASGELTVTVDYTQPIALDGARLVKAGAGGFTTLQFEALVGGVWTTPAATWIEPLALTNPSQMVEARFATPVAATALRARGTVPTGNASIVELDGVRTVAACRANCDESTATPSLSPGDFSCFLTRYRSGDPWADCDRSASLSPADFTCFLASYRAGCP
jgi:hypothetical protein